MKVKRSLLIASASVLAVSAIAAPQIKQLIKLVSVGAAVDRFGGDINKALNKLTGFTDTNAITTKVVPILSVGDRQAIGAAQVMGPKNQVSKVNAVAALNQGILGNEIKITAYIPIAGKDVSNLKRIEGVGMSGIVDLKL